VTPLSPEPPRLHVFSPGWHANLFGSAVGHGTVDGGHDVDIDAAAPAAAQKSVHTQAVHLAIFSPALWIELAQDLIHGKRLFFYILDSEGPCRQGASCHPGWSAVPEYAVLVWCPLLESRGTSLEKVLYRNILVHHTKLGCFGRLALRATCCTRNIFKKPCTF
jgi:hypothetical protein